MNETNSEVTEAIVIEHDPQFDVDVVEAEVPSKPKPLRRADQGEVVAEKVPFEKVIQVRPAITGADGEQIPFNPKDHVAFAPSDDLRERINGLVDLELELAKAELEKMIEEGEITEMRVARLTQPLSADPVPGRVTVVINPDKTVNSVTVE